MNMRGGVSGVLFDEQLEPVTVLVTAVAYSTASWVYDIST